MISDGVIADLFPALQQEIGGHSLVYLDSAATTQKPQCVIDAITNYYEHLLRIIMNTTMRTFIAAYTPSVKEQHKHMKMYAYKLRNCFMLQDTKRSSLFAVQLKH